VVDGAERAASPRHAARGGLQTRDFKKSQIGIASTWTHGHAVATCTLTVSPRNPPKGVDAAGGKSIIFNTITISDGISMGTEGMKYSLVSSGRSDRGLH